MPDKEGDTAVNDRLVGLSLEGALPFLDYLGDGILVLDPDRRIVGFNALMERISGLPREQVLGKPCAEVLPCAAVDGTPRPEGLGPREPPERSHCRTLVLLRPDGEERRLHVRWRPICGPGGDCRFLVGTVRDVTREEELHARERRARSLSGMGQIAHELAEQLRDPLNGIDIQVQLLGRLLDRRAGATPEAGRVVKLVRQEIRRLNSTLRELFDAEVGRPHARRRSEVRTLLEELAEVLEPRAEALGVDIRVDVQDGLEPVLVDVDSLMRALLHLGMNAIDAMPQGGEMRLLAYRQGPELKLVIADSGAGVPEHLQERIFRMFYSTKPDAAGVGLPLAANLVSEQGGTLRLERTEDGTEFVLTLPLR